MKGCKWRSRTELLLEIKYLTSKQIKDRIGERNSGKIRHFENESNVQPSQNTELLWEFHEFQCKIIFKKIKFLRFYKSKLKILLSMILLMKMGEVTWVANL